MRQSLQEVFHLAGFPPYHFFTFYHLLLALLVIFWSFYLLYLV